MSSEQKFNCIFCKDVFDSKEELQVHFRKHGDPTFNPKKKPRFPNESKMSGEKPSGKPEMVGCDVCSEVFPTISKAITHKHKVHPDHDAKYFCPWCGKLFTMKHLYNKHMQANHNDTERPDDKDFHCDPCDVDFYIPSAVSYHNKFFHRQDTELPDVGQSKKFKLHNQEVVPLFYCAFCGEEYDNKINLLKHMTDDHSDENQSPDEVLRCPLCEAIFYHLDAYEIHITFHSSEDLYTKKNEMYGDLQEFSLESLSPVVEKVENMESQEDAETTMNSVGIDKFLELAMDQPQDTTVKVKKHKKHKKSKKSAITLDEFLSMNQDVFGEGLDFQGVEEVPTRVVAKRLKVNKKPVNTSTKTGTPVELEKLKQQGIVIKKKVNQNPSIHGIKVFKGVTSAGGMPIAKKTATNKMGLNTSDEVLSKLMSQSNSAIKIIKKSIHENTKQESELSAEEDDFTENINEGQKNISKSDATEDGTRKDTVETNYTSNSADNNDDIKIPSQDTQNSLVQKPVGSSLQGSCHETVMPINKNDNLSDTVNPANNKPQPNLVKSQNAIKSLNTLHNIGQIVIKPKSCESQTNKTQTTQYESEGDNNWNDNMSDSDYETNVDDAHDGENRSIVSESTNKSISALKHLSQSITVKPVNQAQIAPSPIDGIPTGDTIEKEVLPAKQVTKAAIVLPPPAEKGVPMKHLRPQNTVKYVNQANTTPSSVDDFLSGDTSDEELLSAKQNTKVPIALPPPAKKAIPIKHLRHLTTIKNVNQAHTTPSSLDGFVSGDISDEEVLSAEQNTKAPIALPPPAEKEIPINHLRHITTVKNVNQVHRTPSTVDGFVSGDTSDEEVLSAKQNTKAPIALPPPAEKEISIKHLRHITTVKNVNPVHRTPSTVDGFVSGDTSDEEVLSAKQNTKAPIALPPPAEKEIPIKHIRHITTVKHVNQAQTTSSSVDDITAGDTSDEELLSAKQNTKAPITLAPPADKEIHIKQKCNDNDPTLDALKSLSKNITIKSFPKPTKGDESAEDNEFEEEDDMVNEISKEVCNKDVIGVSGSKNLAIKNIKSYKNEPKLINSLNTLENSNNQGSPSAPKTNLANSDNNIKRNNADILKRLTNITTKPVALQKVEQIVCMPTIPRQIVSAQNEDEIEIYNIDDSDDDDNNHTSNKETAALSTSKPDVAFKQMTVKSVNQQCIQRNIKIENDIKSDEENIDEHNTFTDDSDDNMNTVNTVKTECTNSKTCSQKLSSRNMSIKNALKNLGKNIVVKSRNSSPSLSMKSQDHSSQDSNLDANEGSDTDSDSGKVKISEVNEYASDDELNHETNIHHDNTDAIVQSPGHSGGEDNDELCDFENEIKASTLHKSENDNSNKNPMLINTLKNLGKNITIKSFSEPTANDDKTRSNLDNPDVPSSFTKKIANKPFKHPSKNQSESVIASSSSSNAARAEHLTQSVNRKMSSSNQVNTVNKEVTVKTFQTKTVIQEITTTVTKTIKTINQTMKQEIRNSSQTNSTITAPRIPSMRQNQSQNLQGVLVRNASPIIGNPGARVRSANTMIRPAKSIVPMRAGLNIARPTAPRMPIVRRPTPAPRPQKHVIGKPLKISPNAIAMAQAVVKRPNSEEMTGPFSCFKKPKESLIPVSEVPNLSGEFTAQHASTSHTSSSNFTSTTKVVKGNSVVTSTQMKSEMSASAQQISRLGNNSGLKIVKKSQAKEMQTQEKSETNAMKLTILAAIEKLQKQGLLVKKPRLDINEDSENSEADDDNTGFSSDEEHNT